MRPMRAATGCEFEAASETGRVMQTGSDLGYGATSGDLPWNPNPNILTRKSPCEPDPGTRPHPARPAHEEGPGRHHDARLQAQRHHDIVRRARCGDRQSHRQCLPRHRATEFLRFLKKIDLDTPARLDLHLILDNYSTHKTPAVKRWLKRHPRFKLHFTPTACSWLNLVERLFAEITRQRIRRDTFDSVPQLEAAIVDWIDHRNAHPKPFVWTAKANRIIAKHAHARLALENIKTGSI